ncbi:MAG: DUF4097 domain-containing protein [Firmicutes bacterium]|nr:DUF4097 domain-containing protein [Bacillota bacterium]
MKKLTIFGIIIFGAMFVGGLILTGIGFAMNGFSFDGFKHIGSLNSLYTHRQVTFSETDLSGVTELNISSRNRRIYIRHTAGDALIINLYENENEGTREIVTYNVEVEANRLNITTNFSREWWHNVQFVPSWTSDRVRTIEVLLPSWFDAEINASTENARINVRDIQMASQDVSLTTSNSRINVSNSNFASLSVETSSGRVSLNNVSVAGAVSATTSTARIYTNGVSADTISLRTSSARINARRLDANSVNLHTSSGRIDTSLVGRLDDFGFAITTNNNRINVQGVGRRSSALFINNPGGRQVVISTSSARVNVSFA